MSFTLPTLDKLETLIGYAKVGFKDVMILLNARPKIVAAIEAGKTPLQAITEQPEVLTIIEDIANSIQPGAGAAIDVVARLISIPDQQLTEEELQKIRDDRGLASG